MNTDHTDYDDDPGGVKPGDSVTIHLGGRTAVGLVKAIDGDFAVVEVDDRVYRRRVTLLELAGGAP